MTEPDWYLRLLDTCPPIAHTVPNWELPDRLNKYEALAKVLHLATADGRTFGLMDHQRLVLRLLSEYDPVTGQPRFFEVDLLTPRQIGKTTIKFISSMERMLLRERAQRCVYSSQSHNSGMKKMKDDWIPLVEKSGLKEPAGISWALNTMRSEIRTESGSYIRVVAGGAENADRGITSIDYAMIDEALADRDDRKERVLHPAMMTVADSQQLLGSTPGNVLSLYLMEKRRVALAAVNNPDANVALVEYAAPMDADITQPETWMMANPALGQTIPMRAYERMAESMSEVAFRREGLGQWVADADAPGGIPREEWDEAKAGHWGPFEPMSEDAVLGIDCTPDQTHAFACVANDNTVAYVGETSDVGDIVGWVARMLHQTGARRIAVQAKWALAHKTDDICRLPGVEVMQYVYDDWLYACGVTLSAFIERDIKVRPSERLDVANVSAMRRPRASRWMWDRGTPNSNISPLISMTCAIAGARSARWQPESGLYRL